MTRHEARKKVEAQLAALPDKRLELLAELVAAWGKPSVFSTLSDAERSEIDAALDELDAGAGVPWATVKSDLEKRIAAKSR